MANQNYQKTEKKKLDFIYSIVANLEIYCPQMSVEVSYFVACQFALESNYGKSGIATTRNNLCGMRVPYVRLSNNRSLSGFSRYDSVADCVIDYCYWLSWNHFDVDTLYYLDKFTQKLTLKKYCPDPDYIERINNIYQQFKNSTK